MPATPIYQLPYPAAADPADVPLDMQELAEQIAKILGGALSATPPASPVEGQLWALSPAAGVVWLFRYNAASASAFKWEAVSGSEFGAEILTNEAIAVGGYIDLATVGPSLTAPRAGEYVLAHGATLTNGAAGQNVFASPKLGGAATSDTDRIGAWASAGQLSLSAARQLAPRTLAASDVVKLQYSSQGGSATAANRWLRLRPLRVS